MKIRKIDPVDAGIGEVGGRYAPDDNATRRAVRSDGYDRTAFEVRVNGANDLGPADRQVGHDGWLACEDSAPSPTRAAKANVPFEREPLR